MEPTQFIPTSVTLPATEALQILDASCGRYNQVHVVFWSNMLIRASKHEVEIREKNIHHRSVFQRG